jgi:hypothetical protein
MDEKEFDLNEPGGLSLGGHTYNKLKSVYDVYVGKEGLLGYDEVLIDWDTIRNIYKLGVKRGWIK